MISVFAGIERSLSSRMLGHAFALLKPLVGDLKDKQLQHKLAALTEEYMSVVKNDFLADGTDGRWLEMIDAIVRDTFLLSDTVSIKKKLKDSTSYEIRELLKPLPAVHESLEDVFRYYWLADIGAGDVEELLLMAGDAAAKNKALMAISALTLNVLRSFSTANIMALFRLADENFPLQVRERAWVGLILLLLKYDERMQFFPDIQEELQELLLTEDGQVFARTVLTCLVKTMGVDWANSSYDALQKQLAPWIAKNIPGLKNNKATIFVDDIDDFSAQFGEEFKNLMEGHSSEMIKMHEEHLDTHFAMMSSMYSTPFFSEPYRWWLPFDENALSPEQKKAFATSKHLPLQEMCDSDIYALIAALAHVGVINGGHLLDDAGEEQDEPTEEFDPSDSMLSNGYIKQAYRFFRLNPWQMENPFTLIANLPETLVFKLLNPTANEKALTAEQCQRCHAYVTAADIYRQVADILDNAEVYRNFGLALQKEKNYALALTMYQKAQQKTSNHWVEQQIAYCLVKEGDYRRAMEVLQSLAEHFPDNMLYHYELAQCMERLELYAEALQEFMLIELKHPGTAKVQREVAWCSFLCNDFNTALMFYEKLQKNNAMKGINHLNIGHVYFVLGNRQEALMAYQRAMRQYENIKSFLQAFRPDRHFLLEKGLTKNEIYLMEDQLIYIYSLSK